MHSSSLSLQAAFRPLALTRREVGKCSAVVVAAADLVRVPGATSISGSAVQELVMIDTDLVGAQHDAVDLEHLWVRHDLHEIGDMPRGKVFWDDRVLPERAYPRRVIGLGDGLARPEGRLDLAGGQRLLRRLAPELGPGDVGWPRWRRADERVVAALGLLHGGRPALPPALRHHARQHGHAVAQEPLAIEL